MSVRRYMRYFALSFLLSLFFVLPFLLGLAVFLIQIGFGAGLAAGRDVLGWWIREGHVLDEEQPAQPA